MAQRRFSTVCSSLRLLVCLALAAAPAQRGGAQEPAPQAKPGDFGLELPESGPVRQGDGRRVTLKKDGKEIVAQVLVDVGDRRVLVMPGGQLESVRIKQTKATEQAFVPATKEDMIAHLTAETFKGFKNRTTNRYLYIYNTSEGFYKATSRILETMYPGVRDYFKRQKFPVHEPDMPMVVIMFRTEEEFQKYHAMPPGVVAYYSGVSNHIVMYEQSKLVEVAPELAVRQSIATIAHEGVHQILHNIGVQQRLSRWPMWISEGLPEYFSPTSTDKRLRWKGVGQVNDMRMYELEQFLKQGSASRGDLVDHTVRAQALTSTGYASAWALTHYMAKLQKEKFFAYLTDVAKSKPLEDMGAVTGKQRAADQQALFAKHFGKNYGQLEDDLIKHLKKQPYSDPIANQTHYVVMLETSGGRSAGLSSSPAAVKKYQDQLSAQLSAAERARASFQVRPFPNKDAANEFMNGWLGR